LFVFCRENKSVETARALRCESTDQRFEAYFGMPKKPFVTYIEIRTCGLSGRGELPWFDSLTREHNEILLPRDLEFDRELMISLREVEVNGEKLSPRSKGGQS
jgi:hypothetical protein